jgi:hypothetical protein
MHMQQAVTRRTSGLVLLVCLAGVACNGTSARDQTIYAHTSNRELKQKALQVVKSIRALVDAYNTKDRELRAASDQKDRPGLSREERQALREQWLKESDAAHDAAMRAYKAQYWADAIVLRQELLKRLPHQPTPKDVAMLYQIPTNVLGIGLIADHLELMAKSLPDSS